MSRKISTGKLAWTLLLLASLCVGPGAAWSETASLAPETFADLAQESAGAVVNISTEKVVPNLFKNQPLQKFFEQFLGPLPRSFKIHSLGSGIIMSPQGEVITNNHMVAAAKEIRVILVGGQEYQGIVKGRDPETDLALVQIANPPAKLPFLKLGDSDAIRIGDWVLAVGNPFGLSHTVTQGIISARGRIIGDSPYDRFLQTDASINPGNSGGPLLNLKGEVIGVNTAILAHGQGIGFAIPSNTAKSIIAILKEKGKVTRGMIGIMAQTVTPRIARKLGLAQAGGALVVKVDPKLPAQKAGLRPGDIIISYRGRPVHNMIDFMGQVADTPPGTVVEITVRRRGHEKKFKVKIGELTERRRAEAKRHPGFWQSLLSARATGGQVLGRSF